MHILSIGFLRNLTAFSLALQVAVPALALDVQVIGLMQNRAVIVVDGKKPRTLTAGDSTPDGVRLVSVGADFAVLEFDGKRKTVAMGQSISVAPPASTGSRTTLYADSRGHFIANGSVNGALMRFLVDTGATNISMGTADARRAGVNYLQGDRAMVATANGVISVYKVKLDSVKVGDISLTGIEAFVLETPLPTPLLGMSFLGRLDMLQEGSSMTLIRKY